MNDVAVVVQELQEEESLSKQVKETLVMVKETLESGEEASLKKDKCIHLMEALLESNGLDAYVRTQLLDVLALLESL